MKRALPFLIVGLVFISALGGGAVLLQKHRRGLTASNARSTSTRGKAGAEPPHIRGAQDAIVTLEEFGDYECPPCGNLSPILQKLEEDYRGRLRFVFRQFPMPVHAHAAAAASAAEAAGLQNKFWEMHDRIFRERFIWPRVPNAEQLFAKYAADLGLDVERFQRDVAGDVVRQRIAADRERGVSLGVERTPSLFLDGERIEPNEFNPDGLRRRLDAALARK